MTPVKDTLKLLLITTIKTFINKTLNEPRHEKTCFLHMRKPKAQISCAVTRTADQRLCFRYTDSTIPLLPKSEISSLYFKPLVIFCGC